MDIESEIERLKTLPLKELQRVYYDYYNVKVKGFCCSYYVNKIAYRLQELEYGSLPSDVKNILLKIKSRTSKQTKRSVLPIGSTIIKRYKGQDLRIRILENGYDYDGKFYKSLSGLAQSITGRHVSGNSFFNMDLRKAA